MGKLPVGHYLYLGPLARLDSAQCIVYALPFLFLCHTRSAFLPAMPRPKHTPRVPESQIAYKYSITKSKHRSLSPTLVGIHIVIIQSELGLLHPRYNVTSLWLTTRDSPGCFQGSSNHFVCSQTKSFYRRKNQFSTYILQLLLQLLKVNYSLFRWSLTLGIPDGATTAYSRSFQPVTSIKDAYGVYKRRFW